MEHVELRQKLCDYIKVAEVEELQRIENVIEMANKKSTDFFDELPPIAQQLILKSKAEIAQGKVLANESVLNEAREKYNAAKGK